MALGPKNPRDQKLVVLAMLSVLLGVAYWFYAYQPKQEELATVQQHIDSLESMNRRARSDIAKGTAKRIAEETARYERSLGVMRQLVPTSNEVPALLDQVSTAARHVGLDIASVEPQAVVTGDQFDTYRYRMSVYGGYHRIGEFLTNVGSLTRIMVPMNVAISADQNAGAAGRAKGGDQSQLKSTFDIQTYVARTSAPARPAPAPEKEKKS